MNFRASYTIHPTIHADAIFIVDQNKGRSVTNDAEQVVIDTLARFPNRRIIYRDSEGRWDELKHDGRQFTEFAPLSAVDRNKYASVINSHRNAQHI